MSRGGGAFPAVRTAVLIFRRRILPSIPSAGGLRHGLPESEAFSEIDVVVYIRLEGEHTTMIFQIIRSTNPLLGHEISWLPLLGHR